MKIDRIERTKISTLGVIFTLLAAGFTLISAWNGFNFYRVIFGLSMAILISVTFEIARFACLFRYVNTIGRIGILAFSLYILTASVCAFASINAFTAEVIRRNRINEKEFHIQIDKIKQVYSEKAAEKLAGFEKDIQYLENKVALYPQRDYWQKRLSRYVIKRDKFITERDKFLNQNPDNPEHWIRVQSSILGLTFSELSGQSEEMISVTLALRELWGLEKITAQKIMGIVVTLTVELSILLLAILATMEKKPRVETKKPSVKRGLLEKIQAKFEEKDVKKFLELSKDYFKRTGKLPPKRKLNMSVRPIREYLSDFERSSLKELF